MTLDERAQPTTPRTRRSLLAAAAAAGGALATQALVRPSPVAAADVGLGVINTASAVTTIRTTEASVSARAISGVVTFGGLGNSTAGVYGQSNAASGNGVFGLAPNGPGARGVLGQSTQGIGVHGQATAIAGANVGVRGTTSSTGGYGVQGIAIATSGNTVGVYGETRSNSVNAAGVLGVAPAGVGVYGRTSGTDGWGVRGRADGDFGIGVVGQSFSSTGFGLSGTAGGTSGVGMDGRATASSGVTFGVRGNAMSPNGFGVYGTGGSSTGPTVGVRGITSSPSGYGVQGIALGSSGNGIGVYGQTVSANGWAGFFSGRVEIFGNLFKTGGSFLIDHPQDPANKTLEHSFVEAPERLNIYSGSVTLDARGRATVRMPRYFRALNREYRYQLTVVGGPAPNLHVSREITTSSFAIAGGAAGQKVCWQVTGVRQDAWAQRNPLRVERSKKRKDRGKYLNPEAFGKPRSASIHPVPKVPRRPHRLPRPKAA